MKYFISTIQFIMVAISIFLCYQFIFHSISNQNNKNDYAELNHIKYGLFNVGEWKNQINIILIDEINKLYLTRTDERELKNKIEVLLNKLINEVYEKIKQGNAGSVKGWVRQSFISTFVNLEDIKKGIPQYSNIIIHEMTKVKTRTQIKAVLNEQLEKYFRQTFAEQDTSQFDKILRKTGSNDIQTAKNILNEMIAHKQSQAFTESTLLIILSIILFALSGLSKKPLAPSSYILLVLSLLILLTAGVTTAMIDMEAKISEISFVLLGHPIQFKNQVLYFQTKSILDVFWIMITHSDLKMKFVGTLMVIFSVVFPVLKMISTVGYYYNFHNAKENLIIKFFVLKSGKWSMADVMVIAIFMAYIGFNGIISSQFGQFNTDSQELVILTTNGTSLQPGFYLFLTYGILALFLSGILTRKAREEE